MPRAALRPLALALLPAATLGLMAAAREASAGKFPMPTVLASAFRAGKERLTAMLQLGAYYAAGFLLVWRPSRHSADTCLRAFLCSSG